MAEAAERIANLLLELKSAQAERMFAAAELSRIATERNEARRDAKQNQQLLEAALERQKHLERQLELERDVLKQMQQSLSWRVTAPVRRFLLKLRTKRG
jgi:hypothetical protein